MRRLVPAIVAAALMPAAPVVAGEPCWAPPVTAPVADPFRAPACVWCPGNRGIEYATSPGDPVHAVAAGEVTFAGWVAGVGYVVARHADGMLITYGNLTDITARRGGRLAGGALVGRADGLVHFGVRRDGVYVDPAPMLGELAGVVRLIPSDGGPAAPSPRRLLRCSGRRGRIAG